MSREASSFPFTALLLAAALTQGCETFQSPSLEQQAVLESDTAAVVAAATDYSVEVDVTRFPGTRHPPFPEGVDVIGASIERPKRGTGPRSGSLLFSHVRVEGRPLLWLSRGVETIREPMYDENGKHVGTQMRSVFEVLHAIQLPPLEPEERFHLSCYDEEDRFVVAYVRWDQSVEFMRGVRLAWRSDDRGLIVPVATNGVACENYGYGARRGVG